MKNKIKIEGYDVLGEREEEGKRYAWKFSDSFFLVESAAFRKSSKLDANTEGLSVCGYTTSVSAGCILRQLGIACKFCYTGNKLPFKGVLTALDIAKQNIFMVLFDSRFGDKAIRNNLREFAYMGQGEPGYSYAQIRMAIRITNLAMKYLKQNVYRHLISTCGVIEMIEAYKYDQKIGYFDSRVTMHYSLHTYANRRDIMPIENVYPCKDVLESLQGVKDITGEKTCIGIMLFKNFNKKGGDVTNFNNGSEEMEFMANRINPEKFRVSLCEFNNTEIGQGEKVEYDEVNQYLHIFRKKKIEAKLFSSFGYEKNSACGMLGGKSPDFAVNDEIKLLEKEAENLSVQCMKEIIMNE